MDWVFKQIKCSCTPEKSHAELVLLKTEMKNIWTSLIDQLSNAKVES